MIEDKRDQLADAKAAVVGESENRLVAVLKLGPSRVGETLVTKATDLVWLEPRPGAVGAVGQQRVRRYTRESCSRRPSARTVAKRFPVQQP